MHEASAFLFRAADSCGMGGVDVSAPGSSSATVSGLIPGAGQSSPGFSLPSRLCPVWCFRMAGGPGFGCRLNFRVPHYSRFLRRVRVFLPCGTPRARRKDRSESASGKGRIEDQKIHILEDRKDAQPVSSKPLKGFATLRLGQKSRADRRCKLSPSP
jgi:hypothetical protein